ncbi:MAG: hypothetical protein R3224_10485, partial [Balneolaceae bacterium]|nr:hypothetical protein [Balneolaceae bacterium]
MSDSDWIPTSVPEFKLRFAEEDDTPLILDFIRELAAYEKLSHEVVADLDELRNNLFGDRVYAEVVLGYSGREPVGFALFFHNFSTCLGKPGRSLEDLSIRPERRG